MFLAKKLPRGKWTDYHKEARYYEDCLARLPEMVDEFEVRHLNHQICVAITRMHHEAYSIHRIIFGDNDPLTGQRFMFKRVRKLTVPRFSEQYPHFRYD